MISVSAFCHLLVTAPAAYALGRLLAAADTGGRAGGSLLVVLASALLAGLPAAGHLLGGLSATTSSRAGWTWIRQYLPPDREARLLAHTLGRLPAPGSAWQALHLEHPGQPVRIHLTDGTTLLGRLPDHPPLDQDTVAPTRAAPASPLVPRRQPRHAQPWRRRRGDIGAGRPHPHDRCPSAPNRDAEPDRAPRSHPGPAAARGVTQRESGPSSGGSCVGWRGDRDAGRRAGLGRLAASGHRRSHPRGTGAQRLSVDSRGGQMILTSSATWPSTREREGADMAPRLVCGIRVAAHVLGAVQEAPSAWPALGRCGVGATSSSASREPCATRACRCARPSTSSPTRSLWSASAQPWPSTPVETEPRPAGARADAGRKPLPVRNSRRRGTPTPPPARLCRAGGSPTGIGCWPTPIRWRAP